MIYRLALLSVMVLSLFSVGVIASPASLGSLFADAYTAFAPLYALYRSYAEYLFVGSEVVIPFNLDGVCQEFSQHLEALHMEFIIQTDSQRIEEVTYLAHLRRNVASFCPSYQEQIMAIASMEEPDLTFFSLAADEDLFAAISDLNSLFQEVFNLTLENLEDDSYHWAFDAAFVTRTLINRETIERIDPSIGQILLGSEEIPPPPADLSDEMLQKLQSLVALSDRELSLNEQGEAKILARAIHNYLMERD